MDDLLIDLEDEPERITGLDMQKQLIEQEIYYILNPEKQYWLN